MTEQAVGIWVGDYVLMGFGADLHNNQIFVWKRSTDFGIVGTGAVMCVPAHDTRDHAFASSNELPMVPIVMPDPCMDDGECEEIEK